MQLGTSKTFEYSCPRVIFLEAFISGTSEGGAWQMFYFQLFALSEAGCCILLIKTVCSTFGMLCYKALISSKNSLVQVVKLKQPDWSAITRLIIFKFDAMPTLVLAIFRHGHFYVDFGVAKYTRYYRK